VQHDARRAEKIDRPLYPGAHVAQCLDLDLLLVDDADTDAGIVRQLF
jgi:hypothetical protein